MVREREKKEEKERERRNCGRKRDVYHTLPFFAHVLHFKIKYVRAIRKYELSS